MIGVENVRCSRKHWLYLENSKR